MRITIVVTDDVVTQLLDREAALDTLVQIRDRLRDAGEDRFQILEYATEAELEAIDDTKS